ncbi:OLC1v1019378C2 [Oldenlandia corymbosa var. corymbosa]|uniref:OLC1v1019378C2 n=1 Tax=Oldenlandia corymbosa var. corymbosa TaxID=529605 RepID=A0AAV1EDX5_OLDCO|nr:OLC1v1019378C2 [Oldenlandia corymbosa var. corymbosa]
MRGETHGNSGEQSSSFPVNVVPCDESSGRNGKLNISFQTGEEFSEEFLRERRTPKKPLVTDDAFQQQASRNGANVGQNRPLVYEDLTGLLGIKRRDSESGTETSEFSAGEGYGLDGENHERYDSANRYRREYAASGLQKSKFSDGGSGGRGVSGHASDSPNAYQPYNRGLGFTDGSSSGKMKFLCSFGGRILPRPNDGKLRYVGGETRIMSIRKSLTYSEVVKKTTTICNQPHTIKYQLPGEDLDALISVSCDEDLHHMIEEYHDLERSSQRLRIFLVSLNDPDSPCSLEGRSVPQTDADYHYVVAVNGMLDPSPRRSSSRESLGSQIANAMEGSPTVQRESPTSFHPLEVQDGGTSLNKMSHPSTITQVFSPSPHYTSKAYFAPPMFPLPVQHKESKNSHVKFYEDITRAEGHEFRSPNAMDHKVYDTYHINTSSYYHDPQQDSVPVKRSYPAISHYMESNQVAQLHPQFHSRANDFLAFPSFSKVEADTKRDVSSDMNLQSENFHISEDSLVQFPGNSVLINPASRMVRELSQPQLFRDGGTSVPLEDMSTFRSKFVMEKSPSFSGSSQRTDQQLENAEKCHSDSARNEHIWNMGGFEGEKNWMHTDTSLDQCRNASNATSMADRSNLPTTVQQFGEMVIDRSVQTEGKSLRSKNSTSTLSSPGRTGEAWRGPQRDGQSRPDESDLIIKSQKESMDRDHRGTVVFSSRAIDRSHGRQTATNQGIDELAGTSIAPFNLNYPPNNDIMFATSVDSSRSMTVDPLHQGTANDYHWTTGKISRESEEKENINNDSSEKSSFQDQMSASDHSTKEYISNIPETTVIVEDVTDSIPSDIPSSRAVIPLIQDEPSDGIMSTEEETETESVALESEHEEGNADDDGKNDSIGDSVMFEMEAGIYGLQIIKYGDLEELQELGSGTYGTVYHGKWRGTDVAIKRIKKSCFAGRHSEQDRLAKDFWREAQILSKLHHPNVVAFYGVVPDGPGGTLATVTEYMVDGSLRHVLLRKGALDRRKKLMIALDAAFGMEYLHLKNVVHFDLKCDNLLVNLGDPQRPVCKVGDFGLSRIKRNTLVSGGVRGTLPWMAPELLHGSSNRVSEKVDVFSFGITMWEMLTGEEPYANLHCGAIIGGIVNNTLRPRIPDRCDPEWRKLMEECWSPDPAARPSFTEITNRLRVMSMALQAKRQNRARR